MNKDELLIEKLNYLINDYDNWISYHKNLQTEYETKKWEVKEIINLVNNIYKGDKKDE